MCRVEALSEDGQEGRHRGIPGTHAGATWHVLDRAPPRDGEQLSVPISLCRLPRAKSRFLHSSQLLQRGLRRAAVPTAQSRSSSRSAFRVCVFLNVHPMRWSSPRVCRDHVGQSSRLICDNTWCVFVYLKYLKLEKQPEGGEPLCRAPVPRLESRLGSSARGHQGGARRRHVLHSHMNKPV